MKEPDDHIGYLHAGVVDVVLHVDFLPGGAQQADEGVAENGVAQMADVRGLVWIDAGVFYEGMQAAGFEFEACAACYQACARSAIKTGVDVARAGDFESGEAIECAKRGDDLLGDDFGRLAEFAGQFVRDGGG